MTTREGARRDKPRRQLNVIVRMAMRTMPSGWSKNLEQMEKRGNGFSLFFYVRTEEMQYLVVEEPNGPLVDSERKHLHKRDVL